MTEITKMESIGENIIYFEEVDSTNDVAKRLAPKSKEGTVIIAETQTKGRGRGRKEWISPPGGVWMSVILKPKIDPSCAPVLTLIFGLAVCKVIRSFGLDAKIKWPNDVIIKDRKIAGVLADLHSYERVNFVIVGVGIDANVNLQDFPKEFRENVTSLKSELGQEIEKRSLIQNILKEMDRVYNTFKSGSLSSLLQEWKKLSSIIGKTVEVHTETEAIKGEAIDIDKSGALIILLEDGSHKKIIAGEIHGIRDSSGLYREW